MAARSILEESDWYRRLGSTEGSLNYSQYIESWFKHISLTHCCPPVPHDNLRCQKLPGNKFRKITTRH